MATATPVVGYWEEPVLFPAQRETLFGILTRPEGHASSGLAVTLVIGGGHLTLTNRNRLFVDLARRAALKGNSVLRDHTAFGSDDPPGVGSRT